MVRAYGTRIDHDPRRGRRASTISGRCLTGDLTGAEVRYLVEQEWAETADDVLWRRTKLGLKATADERIAINQFIVSLGPHSSRVRRLHG